MKYRYVGAPCFLSPCEWLNNSACGGGSSDVCVNGQCQGMIEGRCPFYAFGDRVRPECAGFFATEDS